MLLYNILFIILSNAVTIRQDKSILYNRISFLALSIGIVNAYLSLTFKSIDKGIGLYNGLFFVTPSTIVFQIFIYILCVIILQLTSFFPRKIISNGNVLKTIFSGKLISTNSLNKVGEQFRIIEYPLILLFIVMGANFLISSNDIVSIFIAIELQSYGLYLLCSLYRNSELSTFAGLMYFLLGGLSSCFILLGTALLYSNTGTTNLENFYIINNLYNVIDGDTVNSYTFKYINYPILIMAIGFLFKISAAPFHFWSPDVYDAVPTIVTTFITVIAKISIFTFFLELIHYTNNVSNTINWVVILFFSSLLSFVIGAVLGLNQSRIKRLLAYSTISHIGFILLAVAINTTDSIQAFIFYIMQYSLSNLNAFLLLISIGYTFYVLVPKYDIKAKSNSNEKENDKIREDMQEIKDILNLPERNNSPLQILNQLKGYFFVNPILAISLAITIYSFVGVPPLIGFFGKQMVLSAALDSGYIFLSYVAILASVISAVYYLNIINKMFFDTSNFKSNNSYVSNVENTNNLVINSSLTLSISIITLIISLFFLAPQEWLSMTNVISLLLFNT